MESEKTSDHQVGRLDVIIGPMWAGKSTELLRRVRRHVAANEKCLVIRPEKDNRFDDNVITHDGDNTKIKTMRLAKLGSLDVKEMYSYDVIAIDEGQFFPELCDIVSNLVHFLNRKVIVSGLDGDFQRNPFAEMMKLIPIADTVLKLSAVCIICHRDAIHSHRKITDTKIELVGGSDMYMPVCRKCYQRLNKNKNTVSNE
jgi:thymidine kinase